MVDREIVPIEVGPVGRVDEVGCLGHRLGAELGHEAHDARKARGESLDIADVAVVPAEVQVTVGAVQQREMGERARMCYHESGRVGALDGALHPAIEHGLVPRRQLLGGGVAQAGRRAVALDAERNRGRFVVGVPLHDRRVVTVLVDRVAGLRDRLRPYRPGVSPLQREVLEQQHAELVRRVVRGLGGDVAVHAQRVQAGLDRQFDVASGVGVADLGERDASRQQVGALDEQTLAIDGTGPVVPRHVAQTGPARAAVARLTVDDDHHVDRRQWLVAERTRPPELGIADVERPVDLVESGRQPAFVVGHDDTVDEREQRDRP